MNYRIIFFVALVMVATTVFAQEVTTSVSTGATAVLFSFNGLADLGANAYNGGIGGKWYWSDTWAIRGGLLFAGASTSIPANPPPGLTGSDGSVSGWRFGIEVAAERHLTKTRVSPFLGGGIGFSVARTESKNATLGGSQTTIKNNRTGENVNGWSFNAGSSISLFGLGGVEFFLTKEVSLAAEYRLILVSTSRSDEERIEGNTTITTKLGSTTAYSVNTGGALVLAIYF